MPIILVTMILHVLGMAGLFVIFSLPRCCYCILSLFRFLFCR